MGSWKVRIGLFSLTTMLLCIWQLISWLFPPSRTCISPQVMKQAETLTSLELHCELTLTSHHIVEENWNHQFSSWKIKLCELFLHSAVSPVIAHHTQLCCWHCSPSSLTCTAPFSLWCSHLSSHFLSSNPLYWRQQAETNIWPQLILCPGDWTLFNLISPYIDHQSIISSWGFDMIFWKSLVKSFLLLTSVKWQFSPMSHDFLFILYMAKGFL